MDSRVKLVCIIEYFTVMFTSRESSFRISASLNHHGHQRHDLHLKAVFIAIPNPKMPEYGCRLLTLTHPGSATRLHKVSITIFPAEVTRSQMRDTLCSHNNNKTKKESRNNDNHNYNWGTTEERSMSVRK